MAGVSPPSRDSSSQHDLSPERLTQSARECTLRYVNPREFLQSLERAFEGMVAIAERLGDGLVNAKPDVEGANSAYAIITHCIGVTDWWVGLMIAGRPVVRDRDAEFVAEGTVAELREAVSALCLRLENDLAVMVPRSPIRHPELLVDTWGARDREWTQDTALILTLEEIAQHHGHLELGRDILLSP
ncbi:MAG: hypothetical protein BMS9Abin12_1923 [Acidimicrobiia bacterium]|nr:MAG: hypothetical protein BMS9Abin12_1923 [Acidimicrobiia bacterium]